jgi:hypothetical protein
MILKKETNFSILFFIISISIILFTFNNKPAAFEYDGKDYTTRAINISLRTFYILSSGDCRSTTVVMEKVIHQLVVGRGMFILNSPLICPHQSMT